MVSITGGKEGVGGAGEAATCSTAVRVITFVLVVLFLRVIFWLSAMIWRGDAFLLLTVLHSVFFMLLHKCKMMS